MSERPNQTCRVKHHHHHYHRGHVLRHHHCHLYPEHQTKADDNWGEEDDKEEDSHVVANIAFKTHLVWRDLEDDEDSEDDVDDGGDDDEDGDEDDANNLLPILAARRSRSKRKIIRVKRKVYGKNKVLHGTMTVKDGLNQDKKLSLCQYLQRWRFPTMLKKMHFPFTTELVISSIFSIHSISDLDLGLSKKGSAY